MPTRADMIAALARPLAELHDPLPIPTIERPFDVALHPPGSKSIANRALVLAALAHGESTLTNVPAGADDVRAMIDGLRALGAEIDITPGPHDIPSFPLINATARIRGVGGRWKIPDGHTVRINAGAAGTTARFLTAAALLAPPGTAVEIDGDARLRERAMGPVIEAVTDLGAICDFRGVPGALPVRVSPPRTIHAPPELAVRADISSQFVSAMLLIAPLLPDGLRLVIAAPAPDEPFSDSKFVNVSASAGRIEPPGFAGEVDHHRCTSGSYVRLTLDQLKHAGVTARGNLDQGLEIKPARLENFTCSISPDAASVGYFASAAAMTPGAVLRLPGVSSYPDVESQPEGAYVTLLTVDWNLASDIHDAVLAYTGGPDGIDRGLGYCFMSDCPDSALAAAAVSLFATRGGRPDVTHIAGLESLRHKECDRLAALQTELSRTGASVRVDSDPESTSVVLCISPPSSGIDCSPSAPPITFETYNDHRMAMALALIGLRRPGVSIANPACVAKSYPTFWRDLADTLQSTR